MSGSISQGADLCRMTTNSKWEHAPIPPLLERWWNTLVPAAQHAAAVPLWTELVAAYTQSHRFYHNLNHLAHLFSLLEQHQMHLTKVEEVAWAIFYHDFVYEPGRKDNEEQSALKASEVLQALAYPDAVIREVSRLIIATKNHLEVKEADADLAFFLDIDLSILAASKKAYEQYRHQIRREYAAYDEPTFNRQRCAFLKHCLQADSIFRTAVFRKLELAARQNMAQEAAELSA